MAFFIRKNSKHLKIKSTIVCIFFAIIFNAQEPGAHFDFGTYHKTPKVVNGKLQNPIQKLPKDRVWFEVLESQKIQNGSKTYHLSRDIYGDTTSVSENGEFIRFRYIPFPSEVNPYIVYSNYVTNNDWRYFVRYVQDSGSRRILAHNFDPSLFCKPIEVDYLDGNNSNSIDCYLNWQTPIIYDGMNANSHLKYLEMFLYHESERLDFQSERYEFDPRRLGYDYVVIDYSKINNKHNIKTTLDFDKNWRSIDWYEYKDSHTEKYVLIYRDSLLWIKDRSLNTINNIEDGLVKHYNSNEYFKNYPVIGINEPIALSYLHWLEKVHQKYLDKYKIPLVVKYVLPNNAAETSSNKLVTTESFSLSHWKVTNRDYKEFVDYIIDSIARDILLNDYDLFKKPCYDQFGDEKPKYECNLNYDFKIDWLNKTIFPYQVEVNGKIETFEVPKGTLSLLFYNKVEEDTNLIDKRNLYYKYYQYDFKTASMDYPRSAISETRTNEFRNIYVNGFCNSIQLADPLIPSTETCFRGRKPNELFRNNNLSSIDKNCRSTDVFSHKSRNSFIVKKLGSIYPNVNNTMFTRNCIKKGFCSEEVNRILYFSDYTIETYAKYIDTNLCPCNYEDKSVPKEYDFDTNPDALITAISYWQYEAYWNWKNKKRTVAFSDNPAINDYIPSREEFIKIQRGEQVIHPKEVHALPSPIFRYEIQFYPR